MSFAARDRLHTFRCEAYSESLRVTTPFCPLAMERDPAPTRLSAVIGFYQPSIHKKSVLQFLPVRDQSLVGHPGRGDIQGMNDTEMQPFPPGSNVAFPSLYSGSVIRFALAQRPRTRSRIFRCSVRQCSAPLFQILWPPRPFSKRIYLMQSKVFRENRLRDFVMIRSILCFLQSSIIFIKPGHIVPRTPLIPWSA